MKKSLLAMALLVAAGAVMAQTIPPQGFTPQGGPSKANFQEHKQRIVSEIQKHLACVQAAQDHEQLRDCHMRRHPGGPSAR